MVFNTNSVHVPNKYSHFHRSINYLVAYTCCPARRFDDLKCGIGSTACNPKFIPFACVSTDESNRCKKCGVSDMQNDVLQCPIF